MKDEKLVAKKRIMTLDLLDVFLQGPESIAFVSPSVSAKLTKPLWPQ